MSPFFSQFLLLLSLQGRQSQFGNAITHEARTREGSKERRGAYRDAG